MEQSFMDTTKVDLVQETLGTSEEQLLLIIQALIPQHYNLTLFISS